MLHLNTKKIKITIFAIAMTVAFCQTNAQQQLVTLNHNDTITAFYGASAFSQAHSAAVAGDIITLSSGTFNAVNITKAVTIRGAGMFADTSTNTMATIVANDLTINIPQNSASHLYVEGICFNGKLYFDTLFYPYFSKCKFNDYFVQKNQNYYCYNATIVNCVFLNAFDYLNSSTIINCVMLYFGLNGIHLGANTINNCVINSTANPIGNGNIFTNCVIRGCVNGYHPASSATSFNCLGTACSAGGTFYASLLNNCQNIGYWSSIFKTFTDTYVEGETFELQDSIANNYLGTDGTQVGIYGGVMPFDPKVGNPKIRRCNVARRSTVDGKLSVDIEVVP